MNERNIDHDRAPSMRAVCADMPIAQPARTTVNNT